MNTDTIDQNQEHSKSDSTTTNNLADFHQPSSTEGKTAPITHQCSPSKNTTKCEDDHSLIVNITPFKNPALFFSLTLRSLGVIFGDIGTSPLYVLSTIFDFEPSEAQCIGAVSLIIWGLIVVVSIDYGIFILMADNLGEGGTFALCGLLTSERSFLGRKAKKAVVIVTLIAGSLLLGDGALTPAVSVLSAVEGIAVEAPQLQKGVVPLAVVIIILLFVVQRWGTSKIGAAFGPIMCVWFGCLFSIGVWRITYKPRIFRAFNPWEAFNYLLTEKTRGFYQIGGVFLSMTGLEALYADMGHFGRWPIRFSWYLTVFPAVLFNYLGQGALLINDPTLIDNPFYHSVPHWAHWPMVVLATIATIIASQAVITGSFSLISQAIGMGCSVPFQIYHTSKEVAGQIYVPTINYILMILTIAVVTGFQTGSNLTNAYGVTVCSVMIITTILYILVLRYVWRKPWYFVLPFGIFLVTDLYTWSANIIKVPSGGWVAILIASVFFVLGFCWFFGQIQLRRFLKIHAQTTDLHILPARLGLMTQSSRQNSAVSFTDIPIISTTPGTETDNWSCSDTDSYMDFDAKINETLPRPQSRIHLIPNLPIRSTSNASSHVDLHAITADGLIPATVTPGVACFLTTSEKHTPHVFESFLTYMHSIPQVIIFLKIEHVKRAVVNNNERLIVKAYGDSIYHITAFYGYCECRIKPFDILSLARAQYNVPTPDNELQVTIFVPNVTIKVSTVGYRSWFRRWPLYVYSILKSLYPGAAENIKLNPENTVSIGILAKLE